ncbi:hypothetical protein HW49_07375 [Porphyromonadaceae bacterium COT-184 OH4590]|nr:hypothetical protein HW49_07375 [Porphyromonadaceae bacterium COT-184 OH4590]
MNMRKFLFMLFWLCAVSPVAYSQTDEELCDELKNELAGQIEKNRNNAEYLNDVLITLQEAKCGFTPTFIQASLYLQEIAPNYLSSIGCGKYYYKKNNPKKALQYYDLAFKDVEKWQKDFPYEALSSKAEIYLYRAEVYFRNLKNFQKARENIIMSLNNSKDQGEPYFLLAEIYIASKVSNDSILNLSRYWLAADMVEKAMEANFSFSNMAKAERLLYEYSRKFPTEEQIHNNYGIKEGDIYSIKGWIGRTTICRKRVKD